MGTAPPRARLRPGCGIRPGRGVRGCDSDACGFPGYVQPGGSERAGIGGGGVLMELDRGALVVESGRAEEFAVAIRTLADSPDTCSRMGANGRELAEAEFSWSWIVGRWLEQLKSVAAGRDPWAASLD